MGHDRPKHYKSGERPAVGKAVNEAERIRDTLDRAFDEGMERNPELEGISAETIEFIREQLEKVCRYGQASTKDDERRIATLEHLTLRFPTLCEISHLYQQNTLHSHRRIHEVLKREEYSAQQQWPIIHDEGGLELSKADQPNVFYHELLDPSHPMNQLVKDNFREGRLIFEKGSGNGRGAICIAQTTGAYVSGVDASLTQVNRANAEAKRRGLDHLINMEKGDFLETLQGDFTGEPVDAVTGDSVDHYTMPLVL